MAAGADPPGHAALNQNHQAGAVFPGRRRARSAFTSLRQQPHERVLARLLSRTVTMISHSHWHSTARLRLAPAELAIASTSLITMSRLSP